MFALQTLFYLWIACLPFVYWHGIFEGAKVVWFFSGGIGLLMLWIILLHKKLSNLLCWDDIWYLGWLGILVVSSLFGVHPVDSLLGGSYRHQGVLFFFLLWVIGKTLQTLQSQQRKRLIWFIGLGVFIESLLVMGEHAVTGRNLGTIGEPHALAGYLVIGAPFIYLFFKRYPRSMQCIGAVLFVTALFWLRTKVGLVALSVVIGAYVLMSFAYRYARWVVITVIIVLIFLPTGVVTASNRSQFFLTADYENRPLIYAAAFEAIIQKPIIGYGAESGEIVFSNVFSQKHINLDSLMIDRAHNLFLDITLWSGVLGLAVFTWWLIYQTIKLIETKEIWQVAGLLGWLVYASVQPLGVVHWVLFMVLVMVKGVKI